MTYVRTALAAVNAELPGLDPELARYYALLALTTGVTTTLEDVHEAWAIWCDRTRPDHRSILPFGLLAPDVQKLDEPYRDGILRAVKRIAEAERQR